MKLLLRIWHEYLELWAMLTQEAPHTSPHDFEEQDDGTLRCPCGKIS